MKRKNWKIIAIIALGALLVALAGGLIFWTAGALGPSDQALSALESDSQVQVIEEPDLIVFEPIGGQPSTGFILYPGARVDFRSYAPVLRRLAEQNVLAVALRVPLNVAFLNANGADDVIAAYPQITDWIVGGHSLGGVVAASYAASHSAVSGLVLWASYPADDSLLGSGVRVLSIYGSNDSILPPEEVLHSQELLPADTILVEIQGGNHAQFGSYGFQPGDGEAAISPQEQWVQIVEAMTEFLALNPN
jgi:pimeloyl-ACP methyl ester carboxylesterase